MKTKRDGIRHAFDPYTQDQVQVILSHVPTRKNLRLLARVFGRSPDAIGMIFEMAYSTKLLKRAHLAGIGAKIVRAKSGLGMFLGYSR